MYARNDKFWTSPNELTLPTFFYQGKNGIDVLLLFIWAQRETTGDHKHLITITLLTEKVVLMLCDPDCFLANTYQIKFITMLRNMLEQYVK